MHNNPSRTNLGHGSFLFVFASNLFLLFSFFYFCFLVLVIACYQIVARRHENFLSFSLFCFVTHRSLLQIKIQMQIQMQMLFAEQGKQRERERAMSDINSRTVSRNSLNSVVPCLFIHRPFPSTPPPLYKQCSVHTSCAHFE